MTFEHDPRDGIPFTRSHETTLHDTAERVDQLTSRVDRLENHLTELPPPPKDLDRQIDSVATSLRSVLASLERPRPDTGDVIDLDTPASRWHKTPRRASGGWRPVEPGSRASS